MKADLMDGLYAVVHDKHGICAGLVVHGGAVSECAPILRKRLGWWLAGPYLRLVAADPLSPPGPSYGASS